MIAEDNLVTCPWCNTNNTLKTWDENSYKECLTREARRAYRSLTLESVWGKKSKHFYKCPKCGQWSRGNKLRIYKPATEDLEKLGGEPLFEVVNNPN